jgi:hypothetical protein
MFAKFPSYYRARIRYSQTADTQQHDMMSGIFHLVSLGVLALASIAAGALPESIVITKLCVKLQVSVPVMVTNYHYIQPRVDSNIDAIDWTVNTTTWTTPNASERVTGPVHIDRTFSINAQLCIP